MGEVTEQEIDTIERLCKKEITTLPGWTTDDISHLSKSRFLLISLKLVHRLVVASKNLRTGSTVNWNPSSYIIEAQRENVISVPYDTDMMIFLLRNKRLIPEEWKKYDEIFFLEAREYHRGFTRPVANVYCRYLFWCKKGSRWGTGISRWYPRTRGHNKVLVVDGLRYSIL